MGKVVITDKDKCEELKATADDKCSCMSIMTW